MNRYTTDGKKGAEGRLKQDFEFREYPDNTLGQYLSQQYFEAQEDLKEAPRSKLSKQVMALIKSLASKLDQLDSQPLEGPVDKNLQKALVEVLKNISDRRDITFEGLAREVLEKRKQLRELDQTF